MTLDIVITALSDPVAIVHIPNSLADAYTTKLYWTLDCATQNSPQFFNITSNRIEMAIFGSLQLITQEWAHLPDPEVLISSVWRVFEITSGDEDDVGNYDSPHLRHVSSPLAKAGISILYQSSYFTDFLLVKESDFARAANIFAGQGWRIESSSVDSTRPSTPSSARSSFSSASQSSLSSATSPPVQPEITVLPRALACIGLSKTASKRLGERVRKFLVWPERVAIDDPDSLEVGDDDDEDDSESEPEDSSPRMIRRHSSGPPSVRSTSPTRRRPFISYTSTEDGTSLVSEVRILRNMFTAEDVGEEEIQSGGELGWIESEFDPEFDQDEDMVDYQVVTPPLTSAPMDVGLHTYKKGHRKAMSLPYPPYEPLFPSPNPLLHYKASYALRPASLSSSYTTTDDVEAEVGISMMMTVTMPVVELPITWSGSNVKKVEKGKKRCLQLDLRSVGDDAENVYQGVYHLDKSGLVTRFSSLLASSPKPIRMLYSSTFHTANILVESRDVKRAKRLLERKRRSVEWC